MRWWTFGFHKMWDISRVAENLLALQEGLCSTELVSQSVIYFALWPLHYQQTTIKTHKKYTEKSQLLWTWSKQNTFDLWQESNPNTSSVITLLITFVTIMKQKPAIIGSKLGHLTHVYVSITRSRMCVQTPHDVCLCVLQCTVAHYATPQQTHTPSLCY